MTEVYTEIEINSKPEDVRKIFLDFANLPKWHNTLVIKTAIPDKTSIEVGDRLNCTANGMNFSPIVLTNTETELSWRGALPLHAFSGDHRFCFEPSQKNLGWTTFVQAENFTGWLVPVMGLLGSSQEKTKAMFELFNSDLKKAVEGTSA